MSRQLTAGDWVVYRKSKRSTSPGPRASHVVGSPKGESYTYTVDKYWVVEEVMPDGNLLMRTSKGKSNIIGLDDPNLRRASLFQRLLRKSRFQAAMEQCKKRQT